MRIKDKPFKCLVRIRTIAIFLEADILLVEVEAIDCMRLQIPYMMFFTLVRLVKVDEVVVLLQLSVLLKGN